MEPAELEQLNKLLQAMRGGDADALDGIYFRISGRMFALARGIVKNAADAEDVVSDSFVKLAGGIRGYRPGTNGYAFVMRIVRNCAFDYLRTLPTNGTTPRASSARQRSKPPYAR